MTNKTLRDEFAMAALSSLVIAEESMPYRDYNFVVQTAYSIADRMLAEREKGKKDDQ